MNVSRMSRDDRRNHLLDTAWGLMAEAGAEALTLAEVARLAGVSKPIAYDHFGTRTGLLIALYDRYYSDHISSVAIALQADAEVSAAAETIASAYVRCVLETGTVAATLSGAMSGAAELDAMKQDCDDRYLALCKSALEDRAGRPPNPIALVGFLGAAASVAHHVMLGRTTRDDATRFLAALLTSSVD